MRDIIEEILVFLCLIWLLIVTSYLLIVSREQSDKIKTLRAYNEEVWRTFSEVDKQLDEVGKQLDIN